MFTHTTRINYDLIVNELEQGLLNADSYLERFAQDPFLFGENFYQEFRTVGFIIPRQQGKTGWLMKRTVDDPKMLMVMRDERFVWCSVGNYPNYHVEEMPEEAKKRVITYDRLKKRIEADDLEGVETFAFDEASLCFHFVKRKLYKYLLDRRREDVKFLLVG